MTDPLRARDVAAESDSLAALVSADFAWVDQLVDRRKLLDLSRADVAAAMGCPEDVVSDIETMDCDPRLSTLRRYAAAVGVAVTHEVAR